MDIDQSENLTEIIYCQERVKLLGASKSGDTAAGNFKFSGSQDSEP